MSFASDRLGELMHLHPVYRPRFLRHRVEAYAASAAG